MDKARNYAVQKDYYVFPVGEVYYVKFRNPATRNLESKKSTGLKNKTLAERFAHDEWERRLKNIGKTDDTFAGYAKAFYIEGCPHEADRKADGKTFGGGARATYKYALDTHLLTDPISDMRVSDIKRSDVILLRDRLIKKLGLTRRAQFALIAFKNIIHTAFRRGAIDIDPTFKIDIARRNKAVRAAVCMDDIKRLFLHKYWTNEKYRLAVMTAALTGLRAGEICALKWQDIDAKRGLISVVRAISKFDGLKAPKWGKSRVTVYPDTLKAELEKINGNSSEYCFSSDENPLSYYALNSAMKRAVIKAGIPALTLHGLRHSIQTALRGNGVHPELLRASFGWCNEQVQEGYTHRDLYNLTPQKEAVDKLFKRERLENE